MNLNKHIFINAYPVIDVVAVGYDFTYILYDINYNKVYLTNLSIDDNGNVQESKFTRMIIFYINKV